ncbi:hypothetical protein NIES2100_42640 [Calothrix sp. NIES-2100]|nr:hypothetical protein NIES2100_42640 [Calothrix sp. NIES-2100]
MTNDHCAKNIYAQILNKELNFVSTEILGERQAAG